MEHRHSTLKELFRGLSKKVDEYNDKHAEQCLEEAGDDVNAFYECVRNNTEGLRDNLYKFEALSLYSDLRERECRQGDDYESCVRDLLKDLKTASSELEQHLE